MKRFAATLSAVMLVGSLAGSALAAGEDQERKGEDQVKAGEDQAKNEGSEPECHFKFPAIRQRTLSSDSPQLKGSTTGDVIDFYGPCDESATSANQITQQKKDEEFRFGREYEDGD
jgi:hypothetical protein